MRYTNSSQSGECRINFRWMRENTSHFCIILSSLAFGTSFPFNNHRTNCQKRGHEESSVFVQYLPCAMARQAEMGGHKSCICLSVPKQPQGTAQGRRQLEGSGEGAESPCQQQGCMAHGLGHQAEPEPASLGKTGDARSLKCCL